MKTRTITARVNANISAEIEFLKSSLHLPNITSVLTFAVHMLYESVKDKESKKSSLDMFEERGLLGCFSGPSDLSTSYKKELASVIAKKHSQPRSVRKKIK